jgi:AcrR family transcriptional regulator
VRPAASATRAQPAPAPPSVEARLIAIAADQICRLGARRVTVVGVASAAGMTHANVYRYFPSKVALIDAVVARWLKSLEAHLAEIADAPDPADDKLERLLLALARAHRDLLREDRHLFDVYVAATEASRALVRKHRARLRQLIERVIDEGVATQKFEERDHSIAFVSDAVYRFINPVAVRLDADMPMDMFMARLNAVIRAVQHALNAGATGPDLWSRSAIGPLTSR